MRQQLSTFKRLFFLCASFLFLLGCEGEKEVISNIDEREANLILVLLESKGISAMKVQLAREGAGGDGATKYTIMVPEHRAIDAISYLNQNGFPRKKGANLLEIFSKSGLVSSEKEETIRYQAGLAEQISNMLLSMDGVIDANVQLSFPAQELFPGEEQTQRITAAIYIKHQGAMDDPNLQLESKIKRLVSGSISGLDINDVTVVSDRSRLTDLSVNEIAETLGGESEYVKIWSIVMSKQSASRFRFMFFLILFVGLIFALATAWLCWKFYPIIKQKGIKTLTKPLPLMPGETSIGNKATPSSQEVDQALPDSKPPKTDTQPPKDEP